METSPLTSEELVSSYIQQTVDEGVFPIVDPKVVGIHIVRRYEADTLPATDNRRMFIKLYVDKEGCVRGGVDMVKGREEDEERPGYSIVYEDQKGLKGVLHQKYTNFFFGVDEGAVFDKDNKKIIIRSKQHTVTDFVNVLVKNHLSDMFRVSRIKNFLKDYLVLSPLFWLADSSYKKDRMDFLLQDTRVTNNWRGPKIREVKDPFFRFFEIYKNTLLISLILILPIVFVLSLCLDPQFFTITNPLFLLMAFLAFFILEKIDDILFHDLEKKGGFVYRLTESTLNMKGKLKI